MEITKVTLKLTPNQLARYKHKDSDQQAKYMAYLEGQHIARARQVWKIEREADPSIPDFNKGWFKAWNKLNKKPLNPRKERFKNTHLESSTLCGD